MRLLLSFLTEILHNRLPKEMYAADINKMSRELNDQI